MEEQSIYKFNVDELTTIHPVIIAIIIIGALLIVALPRRYSIIPFLLVAIFVPLEQRIVISGINFHIIRILIAFGWLRMVFHSKKGEITFNTIDTIFIIWVFARIISLVLLWQNWGSFVSALGFAYNALGLYFFFRSLIVDWADYRVAFKSLSMVVAVVAFFMLIEQITERNIFSLFGGVPEFTPVRAGRLRSQGAFAHPITAGMFGATLFPILFVFWWKEARKITLAMASFILTFLIILTSSSSGPMLSYFIGIAGLLAWPFRKFMRGLTWAFWGVVVGLHLVMKAPVWALIGRADVVGGSSGYHRYMLVDNAIKRIDEWWLIGTQTTDHWGYDMGDMINQYVSEGTQGGILSLILFVAIIYLCFRKIGIMVKIRGQMGKQLVIWSLGAAMGAHVFGFFGISYWDQQMIIWYMLLAMISRAADLAGVEGAGKETVIDPATR